MLATKGGISSGKVRGSVSGHGETSQGNPSTQPNGTAGAGQKWQESVGIMINVEDQVGGKAAGRFPRQKADSACLVVLVVMRDPWYLAHVKGGGVVYGAELSVTVNQGECCGSLVVVVLGVWRDVVSLIEENGHGAKKSEEGFRAAGSW
ncbi:hypothetical protein LZ30DRAFT_388101 [Colletotrichum cereale]|nr:hypothetical protein LZ30DRAFT_388101 [Colletotrichum cereale]